MKSLIIVQTCSTLLVGGSSGFFEQGNLTPGKGKSHKTTSYPGEFVISLQAFAGLEENTSFLLILILWMAPLSIKSNSPISLPQKGPENGANKISIKANFRKASN